LVFLGDLRAANGAVKLVRVVHSKWLGLFRQPRTGSTLPVDGRSISPVNRSASYLPSLCCKVWFSSCADGIDWVYSLLFTKNSLSLLSIGGHKEEETYREDPIPMISGPWEQLFQDPHSWIVNRNKAFRLSLVLHDMPAKYPKDLPRFNGDDAFAL
jgi:hypothetical protein